MEQFRIGKYETIITPPLGVSMAGYYHDRRADDVVDDLWARAVVIEAGGERAALVVCDLIELVRPFTVPLRHEIAARIGIPFDHILTCCTHTHTGPQTVAWPSAGIFPDDAYMSVLGRKIADAVALACKRMQPAALRVGRGHVEGIAFNRRYWMSDGSVRTNPRFLDPALVRRAGPEDPELGLLLFESPAGEPLALVSNYAVHPDQVTGTAFCADHEGVEARLLKQVLGAGCAVLVPNGCCGDINHWDFFKPAEGQQSGPDMAERSGHALAGEALRQLPRLRNAGAARLRAAQTVVAVDLRAPTPDELAWAVEKAKTPLGEFDAEGLDVVRAHRMIDVAGRVQSTGAAQVEAEVIALALGDVAIVGLPGEIFVQLGLAIKERSPFPRTLVFELCNDCIGYVLTAQAYDEGGYESASCIFKADTGERLVEAAVGLLRRMKEE